jgi:hypothetical protein
MDRQTNEGALRPPGGKPVQFDLYLPQQLPGLCQSLSSYVHLMPNASAFALMPDQLSAGGSDELSIALPLIHASA